MKSTKLLMAQAVRDSILSADFGTLYPIIRKVNFYRFANYCQKLANVEMEYE
jgi:hypothetical protein